MIKKIIYIALILAVLGGAYGYYQWNRGVVSTSEKKADITLSANDLATQYADATHAGKIIEVSGKVTSIATENGVTNISLETSDPMTAVVCELEKGAPAVTGKEGDNVVIRGQCDGKLTDIVLTRCIVVK